MVRNRVWSAAGMRHGFLCIGCLESRIGRRLTPRDFTSAPINEIDNPWHTIRLTSRLIGLRALRAALKELQAAEAG